MTSAFPRFLSALGGNPGDSRAGRKQPLFTLSGSQRPSVNVLFQLFQQRLRGLHIRRITTLGEPVIGFREQEAHLILFLFIAPQLAVADRRPQSSSLNP